MARTPSTLQSRAVTALTAAGISTEAANLVSGNPTLAAAAASVAIYRPKDKPNPNSDRNSLAQPWQMEAYRHVHICGEARYAVSLFAATAGRAEIGISEPQTLIRKPKWLDAGPEVEALAILAPDVRSRTKLVRDFMTHWTIAGECYLIARTRQPTDPGYVAPPEGHQTWDDYTRSQLDAIDMLDPDFDIDEVNEDPNEPIWEIVGVTEIQKQGDNEWRVRHDNDQFIDLDPNDPVIRMWNPDPEKRREAWSPMRSLIGTLNEIEWLTIHIFTQVKSRLMSAGVWFLPENLTFPPPPPEAVEGGAETIALMNEAQRFMATLAASSMKMMDAQDVSFPSIVMADSAALESIDQNKLIKFWSNIDEAAMRLRDNALRRFANGWDMPGSKTIESNGTANDGGGGSSGGATNHWGEWAKQEQTISDHIEPALDSLVGTLTAGFLRQVVPKTLKVIAYDSAAMRLRQDRSKEALELNARGILSNEVTLRETGFDPANDMMGDEEFKRWVLVKMIGGSPTPEQVAEAVTLLTGLFLPSETGPQAPAEVVDGRPKRHEPGNTDAIKPQGPPEGDHEHKPAPYAAVETACEVLVLRALEKMGNRVLNSGKRGRDRDRSTPLHAAHLVADLDHTFSAAEFDFALVPVALPAVEASQRADLTARMGRFCADLYNTGTEYSREALLEALR